MNLKQKAAEGIEAYALATALTALLYELQAYWASFSNPMGEVLIVTNNYGERFQEFLLLLIAVPCFVFLILRWFAKVRVGPRG